MREASPFESIRHTHTGLLYICRIKRAASHYPRISAAWKNSRVSAKETMGSKVSPFESVQIRLAMKQRESESFKNFSCLIFRRNGRIAMKMTTKNDRVQRKRGDNGKK